MKSLFCFGLACVVLGLLAFLTPITHSTPQTFQAGGIGISAQQTQRRPMPGAIGAFLILGGLSMMVGGSRESPK